MQKKIIILFAFIGIIALPLLFQRADNQALLLQGQDTIVMISPHPENNQVEFKRAFADWYQKKTGRTIQIDWRQLSGLTEILKIIDTLYMNAFKICWEQDLGQPWSAKIEQIAHTPLILDDTPSDDTPEEAIRRAYLSAALSTGIDVFFGGGGQEFEIQKQKGHFIVPSIFNQYPEWFNDEVFPARWRGFKLRDADGYWMGVVFSSYGIVYNQNVLDDLKIPAPQSWKDLGNPAYIGELALADPTKSGSTKQVFEIVIQTMMQERYEQTKDQGGSEEQAQQAALTQGWIDGLRLIQRMSANARYFTDKSTRPVMSVASGNCAAAMALDFAALCQLDNLESRQSQVNFVYTIPTEGTMYTPDSVAILRGAPHREQAELFIEFLLSDEGQKIWGFKTHTPGGPEQYALRRLPIRKDFYANPAYQPYRSDPELNPYHYQQAFEYRPEWTEPFLPVFHKIIRAAFIDPQEELHAAWAAIQKAKAQGRTQSAQRAQNILENFDGLDYQSIHDSLKQQMNQNDPLAQIAVSAKMTQRFIDQYRQATQEAITGSD